MTARRLVLLLGLAATAMATAASAAAEEQRRTLNLSYLDSRGGYLDLPEPSTRVRIGTRLDGGDELDSLWPEIWGPVVPYAGIGLGKINLALQLESGELEMEKERDYTRARLLAGVDYEISKHVSLALEYFAVADNDPLFALNVGGTNLEFDTRFTNHYFNLKARYKF